MTTAQIKKTIRVFDFWLSQNGLEINYGFNGAEQTLTATPEQAADLMKKLGLIEDYTGSGHEVAVEVEFVDMPVQRLYWTDFVDQFLFSQQDALDAVTQVEYDKDQAVKEGPLHPIFEQITKRFKTPV